METRQDLERKYIGKKVKHYRENTPPDKIKKRKIDTEKGLTILLTILVSKTWELFIFGILWLCDLFFFASKNTTKDMSTRISRRALARHLSTSVTFILCVENGSAELKPKQIKKLAKYFGIEENELVPGSWSDQQLRDKLKKM